MSNTNKHYIEEEYATEQSRFFKRDIGFKVMWHVCLTLLRENSHKMTSCFITFQKYLQNKECL
ncbi:hypothetical protein APW96_11205 [Staphylococcus aureus]|nr:hypothetical protein APW96_11205 [Staphylococcus aureus]